MKKEIIQSIEEQIEAWKVERDRLSCWDVDKSVLPLFRSFMAFLTKNNVEQEMEPAAQILAITIDLLEKHGCSSRNTFEHFGQSMEFVMEEILRALEGEWDEPLDSIVVLNLTQSSEGFLLQNNGIVTVGQLLACLKYQGRPRMFGSNNIVPVYRALERKHYIVNRNGQYFINWSIAPRDRYVEVASNVWHRYYQQGEEPVIILALDNEQINILQGKVMLTQLPGGKAGVVLPRMEVAEPMRQVK